MASFTLVGDTLMDGTNTVPTKEALASAKFVGLYFSAHWCPPCRAFTPSLADLYTKRLKEEGLEIVFVSSDRDAGSFKEYYREMPWKALPFDKRDLKDSVADKFNVQGIPTLIILNMEGAKVTANGTQLVREDPSGGKLIALLNSPAATNPPPPAPDAKPEQGQGKKTHWWQGHHEHKHNCAVM